MNAPRPLDLSDALDAVEALLASPRSAPGADAPAREAADRRLVEALADLEAAAAAEAAPAPRLAARLQQVRALGSLRLRRVPEEALAGIYDAVRAGTRSGWDRSGMSGAFLDVPASLVRWRWLATAACLLLALGGLRLLQVGRDRAGAERGTRVLSDPRDELLQRVDTRPAVDGRLVRPASLGGAGHGLPVRGGVSSGRSASHAWVLFHVRPGRPVDEDRLLNSVRVRLVPLRPRSAAEPEQN